MDLKSIQTFLRASELGNFTKVANELGYAQSTITMQIQQLEKEVGTPLFERIGRRVQLTSSGREFSIYANEMIHIYQKMTLIGNDTEVVTGHIRIGVLESLFFSTFRHLLPLFHAKYPNVTLEIKTGSTELLFQMLRQNSLDIIYVLEKKILEKDFTCAYFRSEELVFVTSPQNPISQKTNIPLSEVLGEPIISIEKEGLYRKALEQEATIKGLIIEPYIQIDNTAIITNLLRQGMGVSFLPIYVVYDSVRQGTLSIIDVDMQSIQFFSQLFYHKSKWISPPMKGLIQLFHENDRV